jgi:hypothetical protein
MYNDEFLSKSSTSSSTVSTQEAPPFLMFEVSKKKMNMKDVL